MKVVHDAPTHWTHAISFRRVTTVLIGLGVLVALISALRTRPVAYSADPLSREAYVWQRSWDASVRAAVAQHGASFSRVLALGAEIRWCGRSADVVHVPVDYASMPGAIGLALRIGPFRGPFEHDDAVTRRICDAGAAIVERARASGVEPVELQIDFDAATRQLGGYRRWIAALRRRIDVPLTLTALPAWLDHPAFEKLVRSTDGYVLQVHSLERPSSPTAPVVLCDTTKARAWVREAAAIGVPFRVALPTYGYIVAFDASGRFIGLAAEGVARQWPAGTKLRSTRADPVSLAALVATWHARHPTPMTGVLWYRLPTPRDELNWRFETLAAVMNGKTPSARRRVVQRSSPEGWVELDLVNDGDADASLYVTIDVEVTGSVSCDARAGFRWTRNGSTLRFEAASELALRRLAPGERRPVGWIRAEDAGEMGVRVVDQD